VVDVRYNYNVGDLVELARYGYSPKNPKDIVLGTVVAFVDATDYHVPRYKIRVQYKSPVAENALDEYVLSKQGAVVTVMEYDIAGRKEGASD